MASLQPAKQPPSSPLSPARGWMSARMSASQRPAGTGESDEVAECRVRLCRRSRSFGTKRGALRQWNPSAQLSRTGETAAKRPVTPVKTGRIADAN